MKPIELIDPDGSQDRVKYGVSLSDTYNLHCYIALSISNGLKMLANNAHGWPGHDFPEYEDWINALNEIAGKLEFVGRLDEMKSVMCDQIDFSQDEDFLIEEIEDGDFKGYFRINDSGHMPGMDEYSEKSDQLDAIADHYKTEALNWLNKYWGALWD